MRFQHIKPTTPSQRYLIKVNQKHLRKRPLLKAKLNGLKNVAGKNNSGQITSYHKGGGHKKKYRVLNFYRVHDDTGMVTSIEYDPNRTAHIASIYNFLENSYFYILAPKNLEVGDIIKSGLNAEVKIGHSLPLAKIPIGSLIHNVSLTITSESKLSRAAGTFSQLLEKTSKYGLIKLRSGENKYIPIDCYATIGVVSNEYSFIKTLGKAGRSRWLNKRPTVRGVAMNPVDHPHGGGEGKSSGGNRALTPWGKPTKGGKTRKLKTKRINLKKILNEQSEV